MSAACDTHSESRDSTGWRVAAAVSLGLVAALWSTPPLHDPDIFWHIKAGSWFLERGRILDHDIFAFTNADQEWTNHSWLLQPVLAFVHSRAGFVGVNVLFQVIAIAAALVMYLSTTGTLGVRLLFAGTAIGISSLSWNTRPQLLGTSLFIVLLCALRSLRTRRRGWVPIFSVLILWANVHPSFLLGILIVVLQATWDFTSAGKPSGRGYDSSWKWQCFAAILGAALVPFATPHGSDLMGAVVATLVHPFVQTRVSEWMSLLEHPGWLLIACLVLLVTAELLLDRDDRYGRFDLVVLLLLFAMAVAAWRHFAVFCSYCAVMGGARLGRLNTKWLGAPTSTQFTGLAIVLILPLAAFRLLTEAPAAYQAKLARIRAVEPIEAVTALFRTGQPLRIFNDYDFGAYLIFAGSPQSRVFIDGRAEPFSESIVNTYDRIMSAGPGWDRELAHWEVDAVVIRPRAALAGALRSTELWSLVYESEEVVAYRRRSGS